MDDLIDQIYGVYDAGFSFAAVILALTIPDVCAHLQLPPHAKEKNGQKARYIRWCDEYIGDKLGGITGEDIFSIRCGVVHEGKLGNKDRKFDKLYFMEPRNGEIMARFEIANSMLNGVRYERTFGLSVKEFIEIMMNSSREWLEKNANNPDVVRNSERLIRRREDALRPMIEGVTCLT